MEPNSWSGNRSAPRCQLFFDKHIRKIHRGWLVIKKKKKDAGTIKITLRKNETNFWPLSYVKQRPLFLKESYVHNGYELWIQAYLLSLCLVSLPRTEAAVVYTQKEGPTLRQGHEHNSLTGRAAFLQPSAAEPAKSEVCLLAFSNVAATLSYKKPPWSILQFSNLKIYFHDTMIC